PRMKSPVNSASYGSERASIECSAGGLYMRLLKPCARIVGLGAFAALSVAQTSQPAQPPAARAGSQTAPPQTLSSSPRGYVLPAKHQTPEQQNTDEAGCFSWAKGQTGIDPMAPASESAANQAQQSQTSQSQSKSSGSTKGSGAKGAAGGAAAGAAIGGIAG